MSAIRKQVIVLALLVIAMIAAPVATRVVFAADADLPSVKLDASAPGPREVEDLTGQNIVREYANAWKNLAKAVEQNNPSLLDRSFVGTARDKFGEFVGSQNFNGLHTRYIDHGHNVKVSFYSPEGSTMQLLDTADIETQVYDGDKLLHSERSTAHYIVLMTVADAGWRIRLLEQVPNF